LPMTRRNRLGEFRLEFVVGLLRPLVLIVERFDAEDYREREKDRAEHGPKYFHGSFLSCPNFLAYVDPKMVFSRLTGSP